VDINRAWETYRENTKISGKDSLGYYEFKKQNHGSTKDAQNYYLDRRKQARLQWLQDPSDINGDNPNNIRREAYVHFTNKKREYLKDKSDVLAMNSKNKHITHLNREVNELKKGYQHKSSLVTT
jgi:hypothetical protein